MLNRAIDNQPVRSFLHLGCPHRRPYGVPLRVVDGGRALEKVEGNPKVRDYIGLFDYDVAQIVAALKQRGIPVEYRGAKVPPPDERRAYA